MPTGKIGRRYVIIDEKKYELIRDDGGWKCPEECVFFNGKRGCEQHLLPFDCDEEQCHLKKMEEE